MARFSDEDASIAERLIVSLLERDDYEFDFLLQPELAIADIQADAIQFREELDFLEHIGAEAPAMRVGDEDIPVSLRLLFGSPDGVSAFFPPKGLRIPWHHNPHFSRYAYNILRDGFRDAGFYDLRLMERKEAQFAFVRKSTEFLATRIASVRNWREQNANAKAWRGFSMLTLRRHLRGPQVRTPGCTFTVTANAEGLRVFWSGAYYVSPNYFGHPTSPISGVLQSGTYIFGVDGGAYGNMIQWDQDAIVSLPGSPFVHLNY